MDTKLLEDIGLTRGEIKVYLALLELGQVTTGLIIKKSGVSTSKVYKILDKLREKGLASYILKKKVKYFKAADPHKIVDFVERKEKALYIKKQQITKELPSLIEKQKIAAIEQEAEIYEGIEGLKTVFNDILNTLNRGNIQYVFGAGVGKHEETYTRFFDLFHRKRERKGIKAKIIFNKEVKGKFKSQEKSKLVEAKYIEQTTPAAINIYDDKVAIALLTRKPVIFLIKSKEIVDSFKSYFNVMWKIAKK